jgi:hypothetical protein
MRSSDLQYVDIICIREGTAFGFRRQWFPNKVMIPGWPEFWNAETGRVPYYGGVRTENPIDIVGWLDIAEVLKFCKWHKENRLT